MENQSQAIIKQIQAFETNHKLLEYKLDGWSIWPLFRFHVILSLLDLDFVSKDRLTPLELLTTTLQDMARFRKLRQARYLVRTPISYLTEPVGDRYRDHFMDDLLLDIGSHFKLEILNNRLFLPRRSLAHMPGDLSLSFVNTASYLLATAGFGPGYAVDIARQLSQYLQEELQLVDFSFSKILRRLWVFYWQRRLYASLLRQIRPQYILSVGSGGWELVAAAREQGICYIDFQHGFVDGETHPTYSWSKAALPYKAHMPVPDYFFLYGEHWRRLLAANGFWGDTLQVVGSLRMDRYRTLKANYADDDDRPCTIVWTSNGVYVAEALAFVAEFLRLAQGVEFRFYIKLHPAYETSKDIYERLIGHDERIHILLGHEPPSTFDLLVQADLHISIASTCHYEALALGVPTAILPFPLSEKVMHLYQAGHAFYTRTPQELAELVRNCRKHNVPEEISDYYFASDALQNIRDKLHAHR